MLLETENGDNGFSLEDARKRAESALKTWHNVYIARLEIKEGARQAKWDEGTREIIKTSKKEAVDELLAHTEKLEKEAASFKLAMLVNSGLETAVIE